MKSWKTPTPEQVINAVTLLGRKEQKRYFFDRLENPLWLEPLYQKGFFRNPPSSQAKEGAIVFPPWPESRYLTRMAQLPEAYQRVREIALAIPPTENVLVHEDLADIALSLPAEMAVSFVPKAKQWIVSPYLSLLPKKLGALIAHLARGGEGEAALDLARAVLKVLQVLPAPEAQTMSLREPHGYFSVWHYEQILEKHLPALVEVTGEHALQLLCDLLETAVRLSQRSGDYEGSEDFSYIWHRAIEDHEQNRSHTIKDALVSAIRDAAEQLAHHNPAMVSKIVALLEARPWRVFHRIALDLLRCFPKAASTLIAGRLTNRKCFDEPGLRHEYVLLLRECFKELEPDQQITILQWIGAGPDLEAFRHDLSVEQMERSRKSWQRDRLAPLAESLSVDWRRRYEELVTELGPPEFVEFVSRTQSWWGPTSPQSLDELRAMAVDVLVAYLQTWEPSHGLMGPSPEGLGRLLADLVESEPEKFAQEAEKFKGLDPTYIRSFLDGLRAAANQHRAFPWEPVLDLAHWVMEQPRAIPGRRSEYADLDPGWVWTRKTIAELFSAGFARSPDEMSFDLRDRVWDILRPITDDPDPTPEAESRYGGSNMEPATLSINTTRGEAMHTVVQYARWVRRHLESMADGPVRIQPGFAEMPEVREVLEFHLDPEHDPALSIRSVYGRWFPWLMLLDATWAASHVERIFPTALSEQDRCKAAWESYIVFCDPYDNVFDMLRGAYARAIEQMGSGSSDYRYPTDPNQRLAEHLMTFYWRGKLSLEDTDGLLDRFYAKATDVLRGHALAFVGRTLREVPDQVPRGILEQLKTLWSYRLEIARTVPSSDNFAEELASFGWWFASGKFDDTWSLEQLQVVLSLVKNAKPDHLVAERLAQIAARNPLEAVQCLAALIEGDREGWSMLVWEEHVRTILATAMESTSDEAREAATTLVHSLGARGHLNFRDLLRNG